MKRVHSYLMENLDEAIRLEVKTDEGAVRKQAEWCGVKPGLRVFDAGCGPGKITSILHEMIQPGGTILGVDYSEERIYHAKKHYGKDKGIDFLVHDLRDPIQGVRPFDLIWARFVLEYNRLESFQIVRNLSDCLKPGGLLCLLDLDNNCLNHYELPPQMENILIEFLSIMEKDHNFDPYSGRKLYSYLYDLSYDKIQLDLIAHHLIYGELNDSDSFNWFKKTEVASLKGRKNFGNYPGGHRAFFVDFNRFFKNPRRFTYSPLIMCRGKKPKTT